MTKPIFLQEPEFENLKKTNPNVQFVDAFERQIKELFFIENHDYIGEEKEKVYLTEDFSKYKEKNKEKYVYAFYPWNNHVVKTVQKEAYFILKTNRNQDLITATEQELFRNYRVGVFGMSVGSNIAFVLTQAGISNQITIADFDDLDTTNLNRILAGLHQVGLNKTVVASQHIYEDNPFAEINTLENGISIENLEVLLRDHKIDCVIEEIDDIGMKIQTRLLALKYKIPVIMITDNGDGVVLHIERYDLGHTEIFDQTQKYWEDRLNGKENFSKQEAGDIIINNIVGGIDKVDPKMIASVQRVFKKELVSWSQLGSAAILGGVVATYALKKIILGEDNRLNVRSFIEPK